MARTKSPDAKLDKYREKRDFSKTAEPSGAESAAPAGPRLAFVIHKHDATRLHYDLRLEIGGTLASWAVPKGPSTNPADKRLAVHVEDHPLEYGQFEGIIPQDEYGGGTVMLWDFGEVVFKPGKSAEEMLEAGRVEFELHGHKLRGGWVLVRSRLGGEEKNWLLIKRKDEFADERDILAEQPNSAVSGRTLDQIAEQGGQPRKRKGK